MTNVTLCYLYFVQIWIKSVCNFNHYIYFETFLWLSKAQQRQAQLRISNIKKSIFYTYKSIIVSFENIFIYIWAKIHWKCKIANWDNLVPRCPRPMNLFNQHSHNQHTRLNLQNILHLKLALKTALDSCWENTRYQRADSNNQRDITILQHKHF